MLTEGGIKHRLQHLQQRLLNQTIRYRRDGGFIMHLPLCALRMRTEYGLSCGPSPEVFVRLFR